MTQLTRHKSWNFLCSWSGGKDSYLACHRAMKNGAKPAVLLNVLNETGDRSRSHGIPREVLELQAECIGIPIEFIESSWTDYERKFIEKLVELKEKYNFSHTVFGDIDIQPHRDWEEKVSKAAKLIPILPLWQEDRVSLVNSMLDVQIKGFIVSCQSDFADHILGRFIDKDILEEFDRLKIDACGENGEYHTLVVHGPMHLKSFQLNILGRKKDQDYAFLDYKVDYEK